MTSPKETTLTPDEKPTANAIVLSKTSLTAEADEFALPTPSVPQFVQDSPIYLPVTTAAVEFGSACKAAWDYEVKHQLGRKFTIQAAKHLWAVALPIIGLILLVVIKFKELLTDEDANKFYESKGKKASTWLYGLMPQSSAQSAADTAGASTH